MFIVYSHKKKHIQLKGCLHVSAGLLIQVIGPHIIKIILLLYSILFIGVNFKAHN